MNVAFGSFCTDGPTAGAPRLGALAHDRVLDLGVIARQERSPHLALLETPDLDALLAAGSGVWDEVIDTVEQWADRYAADAIPVEDVRMLMPFTVADYVDFFASRQHAANLGRILRPGTESPAQNWYRVPIAYHGRAGTVVPSGTEIVRPRGQSASAAGEGSDFGPSRRLDVEVEVGFVVGGRTAPGEPVPTAAFEDHVFGVVLVNDWSARDIQAYEYVPLGPMLGKSFATSISTWVHPLRTLAAARRPAPERAHPVHPHLRSIADWGLDIRLELRINDTVVSQPGFAEMYWTPDQQLAHLTSNGATLRPGDLYASGTVSSTDASGWGSLIELTDNGRSPLTLADGTSRGFLLDGDEVTISAETYDHRGERVPLGDVRGRIVPAKKENQA